MTSQPQPVPGEVKSAGQYLRPLRDLAVYALVGAAAVFIFLALLDLIPDGQGQFSFRTQASFGAFINLETIGFPLAAVLLSLLVQPRHPKAQLIVLVAVIEYGLMALFGIFFGVLIGLINEADHNGARSALEGLLDRVAWLAVFAVAAYAVFQIWRNMFYTPRPKPQPQPQGMYGQPGYNQPGAYPGQPGFGPPPGQPAPGQPIQPGQPGQPGFPPPPPPGGYPPAPGQQGFAPGVYGQPAPAWNQPGMPIPNPAASTQPVPPGPFAPYPAPTSAAPASAPPVPGAPSSPPPAAGTPYPAPAAGTPYPAPAAGTTYPAPAAGATYPDSAPPAPSTQAGGTDYPAEPTQVVPQQETDDRTQKLGDERPGFGPADQDPPRQ